MATDPRQGQREQVTEGDRLPDLSLVDSNGGQISLRALGRGETLIVFLRHLA